MGEYLTNTYNSLLGGSCTYDLGCSLEYPLTDYLLKLKGLHLMCDSTLTMANNSKIKRVEPLWSHIIMVVEGNWAPEK